MCRTFLYPQIAANERGLAGIMQRVVLSQPETLKGWPPAEYITFVQLLARRKRFLSDSQDGI
jgi:hypothetical protein